MASLLLQTPNHTRRNTRLAIQTASLGLGNFVNKLRHGIFKQEITLGEFYLAVYSIALDILSYVPHRIGAMDELLADICPELAGSLRTHPDETERLMIDCHMKMFGCPPSWLDESEIVEVPA